MRTEMQTQVIHAWIYNPDNALFKGQSKKAALYKIHCEKPDDCDLRTQRNSCLLQSGMGSCRFGRKTAKEGYTKRARSYYTWMSKVKSDNADYFDTLSSSNYRGIFKAQDYWCLPYPYMSGIWGNGYPLESEWVANGDMNAGLLEKVCNAKPSAMMGGVINKYQDEVVPKFIHDLKTHYPDLFELLPDERKSVDISFIGRKADISTCAKGKYKMGTNYWEWDGEKLIGSSMLFQPAKGEIRIEITPEKGQPVEITDNSQVSSETVFLD